MHIKSLTVGRGLTVYTQTLFWDFVLHLYSFFFKNKLFISLEYKYNKLQFSYMNQCH